MIHEEQVRQLCAIHTVNNLLQLPSDLDYDYSHRCGGGERADRDQKRERGECGGEQQKRTTTHAQHEWTCRRGRVVLYRLFERRSPTKSCRGGEAESSASSGDDDDDAQQRGYGGEDDAEETKRVERTTGRRWRAATRGEFDDIAAEFTIREHRLISGDESAFMSNASIDEEETSTIMNKSQEGPDVIKLSLMQRLRSHYGTPYFGNYSLEVIEEALKRRGVELEFYRVPDDTSLHGRILEFELDADGATTSTTNKHLIGFVVYDKVVGRGRILSLLTWVGSRIPIVRHFCDVGQHWYAITGVRYKNHTQENPMDESSTDGKNDTDDSSWYLIDSKMSGMTAFHTDEDLTGFIMSIQQGGGLLFRAVHTKI